jgi:uncharacterized protein (TIGR02246 family)
MKRLVSLVAVVSFVIASLAAGFAPAADDAEAQAIDALGAAYRAAFSEADAKVVAELFAPDGDYIDSSGRFVKGREAIEKDYAGYFAVYGKADLRARRVSFRLLDPNVAMIDGVAELVPPPDGPPSVSHYTVIAVKRDGKWLIQSVRENVTYPPSHYEHLEPLEWMIGSWKSGGDKGRIRGLATTCRWSENKNYLVRSHELDVMGEGLVSGTQRIGWDPVAETIRSWMFTSTGDYIEGVWTQEDNRWTVTSTGVLGNGRKIASKNIITQVDDDTFTFQSVERTLDGEAQPDVDTIELKRQEE